VTTIFKPWTVVEVPFPFIDKAIAKKRKALVVCTQSYQKKTGACILAMITSAENSSWPNDVKIEKYSVAGLKKPCVVRLKVFTIESSLVIGEVGHLYAGDIKHVKEALVGAIPT
jgi:mRNA interferase MazF